MTLGQFSMFSRELSIHILNTLSSADLLSYLAASAQLNKNQKIDAFRQTALQILLSRNKTPEDFDNQTNALALCLKTHKNLPELTMYSFQIVKNMKANHSSLAHKIQSIIFLYKIHNIPQPNNLLNNLHQPNWPGHFKLSLQLLDTTQLTDVLQTVKFEKLDRAYLLSEFPSKQMHIKLDEFIADFFKDYQHWTRQSKWRVDEFVPVPEFLALTYTQLEDLKTIVSHLTTKQVNDFLNGIENMPRDVQCALWSVVFPKLSQAQITLISEQILIFLTEEPDNENIAQVLNVFLPKLNEDQLKKIIESLAPDNTGAENIMISIAPMLSTEMIEKILPQLREQYNNTPDMYLKAAIERFIFILLNTLAAKTPEMQRKQITDEMMSILINATQCFYQSHNIIQVLALSHLTSDHFAQYFQLIKTTWDEKGLDFPEHFKSVISNLTSRFTDDQLRSFRKMMEPQLRLTDNSEYRFRAMFYKMTSGITIEEINTYISLLSARQINPDGSLGSDDIDSLNKFIAQIAPQLKHQSDKDQAFIRFMTSMLNLEENGRDPRELHFFIYKFSDFIPSLTTKQATEAANFLATSYACWLNTSIRKDELENKDNVQPQRMPFEKFEPTLQHSIVNTAELTKYTLKLLLPKLTSQDRLELLIKKMSTNGNPQKDEFACNEICESVFKDELIDIDLYATEELHNTAFIQLLTEKLHGTAFIQLLDEIKNVGTNLALIVKQSIDNEIHLPMP